MLQITCCLGCLRAVAVSTLFALAIFTCVAGVALLVEVHELAEDDGRDAEARLLCGGLVCVVRRVPDADLEQRGEDEEVDGGECEECE